jgi:putative PIN family toxin of toxin-antitoxin system
MTKLFIFDTVVLLHAMLSKNSGAFAALKKADSTGLLIVSDATLQELEEKIQDPKFDKYQSKNKRLAFFKAFSLLALNIDVKDEIRACRDPKDDKFLSLAVAAQADCIVTRDSDLLVLNPFQDIPILTPADFLNRSF